MIRRPGFIAAASLPNYFVGNINPGSYRYWRVFVPSTQGTGAGPNANFAVAEIALRGFIDGPNVAVGQTYAASSEVGGNVAAQAFDSNVSTFLETSDSADAWVSVDFGSGNEQEVHQLVYTSRDAGASQRERIPLVFATANSTQF